MRPRLLRYAVDVDVGCSDGTLQARSVERQADVRDMPDRTSPPREASRSRRCEPEPLTGVSYAWRRIDGPKVQVFPTDVWDGPALTFLAGP